MLIGIMQNLPELIGGICFGILTWLVRGWTIEWPVIGIRKYRNK